MSRLSLTPAYEPISENVFYHTPENSRPAQKEEPMATVINRARLTQTAGPQILNVGNAKIIFVAEDRQGLNMIDVWFETDKDFSVIAPERDFMVLRTGQDIPRGFDHMQSLVMSNGVINHIYRQSEG